MSIIPKMTDFQHEDHVLVGATAAIEPETTADNGPLCFKATIQNSQVWLNATTEDALYDDLDQKIQLEYSVDDTQTWQDYVWNGTYGKVITLKVPNEDNAEFSNDTVFFRAKNYNTAFSKSTIHYIQFRVIGRFEVSGNIQTLLDCTGNQSNVPKYCFYRLFQECHITTPPNLPATELSEGCYAQMFDKCAHLKSAPVLPAKVLAPFCYNSMFSSCIALTEAPTLDSTMLAKGCYSRMFKNCISLTLATTVVKQITLLNKMQVNDFVSQLNEITYVLDNPEIPINITKPNDILTTFKQIVSTFPISTPIDVDAVTTFDELQYIMDFYILEKNKEYSRYKSTLRLPATYLFNECYLEMFQGCKSLVAVPMLATNADIKTDYYIIVNGKMFARTPAFDYKRAPDFDIKSEDGLSTIEYCWYNQLSDNKVFREFSEFARTDVDYNTIFYCWSDKENNHIYTHRDSNSIAESDKLYDNYENEHELPYAIDEIIYNNNCYDDMFTDCINLKEATLPFMNTMPELNLASYRIWMSNIAPNGTIWLPASSNASDLIPAGWTRKDL